MSQNITLLNADYADVPSILLPKTGGGLALFTDVSPTTATASDVAKNKTFFDSTGTLQQGTALEIIQGSFIAETSSGVHTVNIPYSGDGYPIELIVCIAEGIYNNTSGGNTTWYNSMQRYAIGAFIMLKNEFNTAPTFATSGTNNQAQGIIRYKNSTTSATTYGSSGTIVNFFTPTNPSDSTSNIVKFSDNKTMKYYTASNSYGLLASMEYDYFIRYRTD